ncbi:MAG: hypothetical protein GX995_05085, partial [Clostridiales bacterium]|nr:hypothetical protein [Clostridiales bacterium]
MTENQNDMTENQDSVMSEEELSEILKVRRDKLKERLAPGVVGSGPAVPSLVPVRPCLALLPEI